MKAAVFASCLVLSTLVTGAPVAERRHATSKFTSIVVFGDSFSDNVRFSSRDRLRQLMTSSFCHQGNGTFLLTNRTWPADPAYFDGRFSDGPVYPEYLLDMLGAHKLLVFAFGGGVLSPSP